MKPWDYYTTNPHSYPDRIGHKKGLQDIVANSRMTELERKEAYAKIPQLVNEWFSVVIKPYQEAARKLDAEFWADCRAELGYEQMLDKEAIAIVEAEAYDRGHSAGYPEIYCRLCSLVDFLNQLRPHLKKGNPNDEH